MKIATFGSLLVCGAVMATHAVSQSVPIVLPTISNPDFETDAALFTTSPGYVGGANPAAISSWPGCAQCGINPGNGSFGAPFRDNGNNNTNVAFLQVGTAISQISQTLSGFEVGENYRIAFDYNSRSAGNGDPQVGVLATFGTDLFIDPSVRPVGGANRYTTGNIVFTPTSDTNTLTFTAIGISGDKTLLLDNVRVFRNGPAIADNGFETPPQPPDQWKQTNGAGGGNLVGSNWTITDGAGITRNFSAFQSGIPAPEGEQHALIQNTGSFTQTVSGFDIGADYTLSLLTMARQAQNFGNDLEVLLDAGQPSEVVLLDLPEIVFNSFTELESPAFTAAEDTYELTIRGTRTDGDRTTFFDNVFFNQLTSVSSGNGGPGGNGVPEPSSVAIWLIGAVCGLVFAYAKGRRARA